VKSKSRRAKRRKPTRPKRRPLAAADGDLHEGETIPVGDLADQMPDLADAGIPPPLEPPAEPDEGLVCRTCGCRHFWVLYVRPRPGQLVRRRECRNCGRRITTVEQNAADAEG